MITENVRKQLADYRKHGKKLKYLINYLMGVVEDEDDFEEIIIREMKALEELMDMEEIPYYKFTNAAK